MLHMLKLDSIDLRILGLLQENGRMSNLEMAEAIGLSPAQCSRRHHRLDEGGVIAKYEARLRPAALGLQVTAFVHIGMERGHMRDLKLFRQTLALMPEVLECHSVTGDFDYVLKVIARTWRGSTSSSRNGWWRCRASTSSGRAFAWKKSSRDRGCPCRRSGPKPTAAHLHIRGAQPYLHGASSLKLPLWRLRNPGMALACCCP
jgi:Lrp/AsnC family leucine-responsive transcriptional regulator